jgi:MYXO-CTERM domain-containing protein
MKYVLAALFILAPISANAGKCPLVMIVLDRSGSMDSPPGPGTTMSKLAIAKVAINSLLTKYGKRLPFGFTTFQEGQCTIGANDGVDILTKPAPGTATAIQMQVAAVVTSGSTNTGLAVKKVSIDPSMMDASRPGSYIILITDGGPTCSGDPGFTTTEIMKAKTNGVGTFVVGFGALSGSDSTNMDNFAVAGGYPCDMAAMTCNGKKYFAADSATSLNAALDAITQQISGEFGSICDDSCYSNGCPNAGEICVEGDCRPDPCANVTTCAPGDYCYTDGKSPGTCVKACPEPCQAGEKCSVNGMCVTDTCFGVSCPTGQACKGGACITNGCEVMNMTCEPGMLCFEGACIHNPCNNIKCPEGWMCVNGTGACEALLTSGGGTGGGRNRNRGGCDVTPSSSGGPALAALVLLALALGLRARRRGL